LSAVKAVSVEGLVKSYPLAGKGLGFIIPHGARQRVKALDGLDLAIDQGTCFCLLGPNGAGKTTLIKILTTLVLPDSGLARVFGFDVEKKPEEVKKHIGCAFGDERSFYWRLSGRQNLEFFGALNGLHGGGLQSRIKEVLDLTGLAEKADLLFNTYSAGMRQMLALARALISDPGLLLVDEPTRSLDPMAAEGIRIFLKKRMVGEMGKTVLLATHDLAEAGELADFLAVIDRGRIAVSGSLSGLTGNGQRSLREIYEKSVVRSGTGLEA